MSCDGEVDSRLDLLLTVSRRAATVCAGCESLQGCVHVVLQIHTRAHTHGTNITEELKEILIW